jgi:putative ABC transport system permease protein
MLKNYFKIAWRNLWKNKVFSLINIFGLSVGIAFTLIIGAYVWVELQINRQLNNADNQYIIQSKWKDPNMGIELTSIAQLPKTLRTVYPHLVANYYHDDLVTTNVSRGERHFRENLQIGDSTLLSMYGLKLLHGDPKTALNDPFSVVLTSKVAIKYFGKTDVIGQTLNFENFSGGKHEFVVTGVLGQTPENSVTFVNGSNNSAFFFAASAAKYFNRNLEGWNNRYIVDYIELQKGVSTTAVEKAMHELLVKNAPAAISKNLTPYLVSLKDYVILTNGGLVKKMTYTLSCIALFILLMAVINFVNICIGRSSGRMKEMGIRKVLGGLRKQLIWQFLAESILTVTLSTLAALLIYLFVSPYFGDALGKEIPGIFSFPYYFLPLLFLFAVLIGLIAGIYPALVLSALKSIDSLKGVVSSVKESTVFRKALIAFQFSLAVIVFIGTIIISQQIALFFNGNLGYNKDYIVYAQLPRDWSPKGVQKMEAIRNQLSQSPEISSVTLSYDIPNGNFGGEYPVYKFGADPSQGISSQVSVNDNQFAATYNVPLKAGTFFEPGVFNLADTNKVAINETELKALGWKNPEEAIGQRIMMQGTPSALTIVGVTADFNFGSMKDRIQPMIFTNVGWSLNYRYFSIKLKPGDLEKNLAAIHQKWSSLMPDAPFEYKFVDDTLKQLYATELSLKKAAFIATILAIVIVLLGVLGLISLSIQKRMKEIGVRKVLGSSVAGISALFLKDFLGVVLIAGLAACLPAYFIMQNWLNDYAYKINISFQPFVFSIIILTLATAVLIIIQTVKAAFSNPVKTLRNE